MPEYKSFLTYWLRDLLPPWVKFSFSEFFFMGVSFKQTFCFNKLQQSFNELLFLCWNIKTLQLCGSREVRSGRLVLSFISCLRGPCSPWFPPCYLYSGHTARDQAPKPDLFCRPFPGQEPNLLFTWMLWCERVLIYTVFQHHVPLPASLPPPVSPMSTQFCRTVSDSTASRCLLFPSSVSLDLTYERDCSVSPSLSSAQCTGM